MELVSTNACFVCGSDNLSGLRIRFQSNPDLLCCFARTSFAGAFQGWGGIVHGGVLSAVLDEACIYAAMGLGSKAVTAELQVRYRKPVPCGQLVTVFGEVISRRRAIVSARARIVLSGEICTEATARIFLGKQDKQA